MFSIGSPFSPRREIDDDIRKEAQPGALGGRNNIVQYGSGCTRKSQYEIQRIERTRNSSKLQFHHFNALHDEDMDCAVFCSDSTEIRYTC